ncbi:hypothetical protein ACFVFH_04210 [Streptomyces sp. NPDC057697]|uniref:hypothetical protein n=1 Tax=Streptomyces sp. NPDC057697 TaxID=3346219 RepID=UPI00369C1913
MIATTPVAQWSWGERGRDTDLVQEAVRRFSSALHILERHRLGTPHDGLVSVKVPTRGHRNFLFNAELRFTRTLAKEIKANLTAGEIQGVELLALCDGFVEFGSGLVASESMFALSVEVSEDYFNTGLTTFSDAWMPFDLRGREQEEPFSQNRSRLSGALADLSEALGLETDPDDPTWFGIPTETGVENHFEDDGSPSDVWGRFEIPYRNGIFSQTPRFEPGYRRVASGPVLYFPVRSQDGVLGYLWASDAEGAASFEARDDADLDGYRAGLVWLDRLKDAYGRGLGPGAALLELMNAPSNPVAGTPAGAAPLEVNEFRALRELAGR